MSVPEKHPIYMCGCGCEHELTRWLTWCHEKLHPSLPVQPESPPPPKRCRISSTSHSRVDASDHPQFSTPQLHAPSFDNFNPSLNSPPVSNLLQPPGDALTEASGLFVDNVLLTDRSDDKDSEGALEGDAVEAADYVDHETDNFWNREDVAVEGDADPHEDIVSDWDLLTEEFIVKAKELGKFGHSLLHTS
jgi:hypothetical protein